MSKTKARLKRLRAKVNMNRNWLLAVDDRGRIVDSNVFVYKAQLDTCREEVKALTARVEELTANTVEHFKRLNAHAERIDDAQLAADLAMQAAKGSTKPSVLTSLLLVRPEQLQAYLENREWKCTCSGCEDGDFFSIDGCNYDLFVPESADSGDYGASMLQAMTVLGQHENRSPDDVMADVLKMRVPKEEAP